MEYLRDGINLSSFWTLWFWITHVIAWSMASHFALGVPFDMIQQANRETTENGPWQKATEAMILAQVFRFTTLFRRFGPVLVGFSAFILSVLLSLAILARLEFALALLTIMGPLTLIYGLTVRTALRINAEQPLGRVLRNAVRRQRFANQVIGVISVVVAVIVAV